MDDEIEFETQDVVNSAINGDIADLERAFDTIMKQKINQTLEVRKQELGQGFGATEEDE